MLGYHAAGAEEENVDVAGLLAHLPARIWVTCRRNTCLLVANGWWPYTGSAVATSGPFLLSADNQWPR